MQSHRGNQSRTTHTEENFAEFVKFQWRNGYICEISICDKYKCAFRGANQVCLIVQSQFVMNVEIHSNEESIVTIIQAWKI